MFAQSVKISSFSEAMKFVDITTKYDGISMHLKVDDYEVDAHSIVGVLSIVDGDKNAVFTANLPENDTALLNDIKPFLPTVQA